MLLRQLLRHNTFELVLPYKINIPVSITPFINKLFVLHSSIKLFRKHLKSKIFLLSLSPEIAKFQKLMNGLEFFAKEQIYTLFFHFENINNSFIGTILMYSETFCHEVPIADIKLILFYSQAIFHHQNSACSSINFVTCCVCVCFILLQ